MVGTLYPMWPLGGGYRQFSRLHCSSTLLHRASTIFSPRHCRARGLTRLLVQKLESCPAASSKRHLEMRLVYLSADFIAFNGHHRASAARNVKPATSLYELTTWPSGMRPEGRQQVDC